MQGLIKALELAGPDLYLDTYWVPVGERVEVLLSKNERQVTRIVLTPPVEAPTTNRTTDTDLWILGQARGTEHAGDSTLDSDVAELLPYGVVVSKIREMKPLP